jgi:hypothetical protein
VPAKPRTRRARKHGPRLTLPDADLIRLSDLYRMFGDTPARGSFITRVLDGSLPVIGRKFTFANTGAALDDDFTRAIRVEDKGVPSSTFRRLGQVAITNPDFSASVGASLVLAQFMSGPRLRFESLARVWLYVRKIDAAGWWPDLFPTEADILHAADEAESAENPISPREPSDAPSPSLPAKRPHDVQPLVWKVAKTIALLIDEQSIPDSEGDLLDTLRGRLERNTLSLRTVQSAKAYLRKKGIVLP